MLSIVFSLLLIFTAAGDDGTGIDPHGGKTIRTAQCGDEGSGLDPHGRPCPRPSGFSTDDGNGLDPHG